MINFVEIQQQLIALSSLTPKETEELMERREMARKWFAEACANPEGFHNYLTRIVLPAHPSTCCLPVTFEPMGERFTSQRPSSEVSVIAADGSAITPLPQSPMDYAVINIGVVGFPRDGGETFQKYHSKLLVGEDLRLNEQGFLDTDVISLRMGVDERVAFEKTASMLPPPVVALTDGQLWLFQKYDRYPAEYQEYEIRYIEALLQMAQQQIVTAGYVSEPKSSYLVRALELAHWDEDNPVDPLTGEIIQEFDQYHPLQRVRDVDVLFGHLKPGERTAIFEMVFTSKSKMRYQGDIGMRFFFMNVGNEGNTVLARVDIPAWVAENPEYVDLLQSALLHQCRVSGSRPYPYIIHRAHEAATFTRQDRVQVEAMLANSLRERGYTVRQPSMKQSLKDVSRR